MDEHLIINLPVANTKYPLRVKRDDEAIFRNAAKEINYKLSRYKEHFTGTSDSPLQDTDYMAMTAIQAVAEKEEQKERADMFEEKINQFVTELDDYLRKR
ncbi:cell division protein ZapA [Dysgonomonas sp. 25]|uniref:cell division protein ZapA n=1 Tax=Dysgonomonas sp. 25 TaxID=2302933 RepID=UPI0013D6C34F|nr:cell division protein ZapA [Dysgonomonas sp. 25]NDV68162.1 cell division protein ZapA [Dysgonomonas sp. 25]